MKNALIVAMVCLNLVLVAVLVFHANAPEASAQVRSRDAEYSAITGKIGDNWDVVYVLDVRTRRLGAWVFNRTTKRLDPYFGRDLTRDFQVER